MGNDAYRKRRVQNQQQLQAVLLTEVYE